MPAPVAAISAAERESSDWRARANPTPNAASDAAVETAQTGSDKKAIRNMHDFRSLRERDSDRAP